LISLLGTLVMASIVFAVYEKVKGFKA